MAIGRAIKFFRKGRRMTQKQLADLVGCAEITIRQYENESREPKQKTLDKIAEALGTSAQTLYILSTGDESGHLDKDGNIQRGHYKPESDEQLLLNHFRKLNDKGHEKAIEQVDLLTKIPEYQREETD